MQAAFGLLRLCSDPCRFFPSGAEHAQDCVMLWSRCEWVGAGSRDRDSDRDRDRDRAHVGEAQHDVVAATVAEARRRLRLLCAAATLARADRTQAAREQLLATLESTALPWRSVLSDQSSAVGGAKVLQHCSTAAPFPAVSERGVQLHS